jgi:hypothetical protein
MYLLLWKVKQTVSVPMRSAPAYFLCKWGV